MLPNDDSLQALREAVKLSPQSIPLRQHLADVLLTLGRLEEAEKEYRGALAVAPVNRGLKAGLAETFFRQDKHSQALVLVEDLLKNRDTPARAYALHARLLVHAGEIDRAVRQYREAVELDPSVADAAFEVRLGIAAGKSSDVVEGRRRQSYAPEPAARTDRIERPTLTFADVGGMEALKEQI